MKLISFAVISFLAITVSAYPHRSAASQELEEPQIDLAHSTYGQHIQSLQNELEELLNDYKAKQKKADKLQHIINEMEKAISDLESRAGDLDESEKKASAQTLLGIQMYLKTVKESKGALDHKIESTMAEYNDTVAAIVSLGGVPE
ncbi:hypothetical protein BASA50_009583 [Batrachochytrium salamandrivorans]|uniref:Uncharacterized protein n=1 Tax=Batrachochytrium salamandrivorans TaxID=1357716 RepID=A0ABQ8F400_9FUNG|nr:hypothetical protein BASA60_009161 [Batrachochytrium salamandrivorans]KAH6568867.1 hypothetical protein BASA62_005234 [Batrachochytrium salamandrivorans]KAH6590170.1 hypothetical protein BASA50_009583 [Batrachochytrium salamandrivorans]KAH6598964.1 hypothetical protein BASA61_002725 [Batrachochytrium salamandrivorans]KAH9266437.1 hypothetical protein BASA83_010555 [Batrachochytrium salamandrivorans]